MKLAPARAPACCPRGADAVAYCNFMYKSFKVIFVPTGMQFNQVVALIQDVQNMDRKKRHHQIKFVGPCAKHPCIIIIKCSK